ncbi:TIGR02301 family protein [Coralliovum pocilloporae]|uniref:TIGR02301 family protein n=1 Tax=Coralliovum pocilloporae TaxID=3066369 RepID=UPI003307414D
MKIARLLGVGLLTSASLWMTGEASAQSLDQAAPYDQKLSNLAVVLGRLHFLSTLCKPDDNQLWRQRMSSLLQAEQPNELRKKRLTASFNQGYRGYSEAYQSCTNNAEQSYQRELLTGQELAKDINNRYGR